MYRTSKKSAISIKDKMDSFHLSFSTSELSENVSNDFIENPKSSVYSNGKRAWFKEHKPKVINQIDSQLRKKFEIKEENNLIVCMYYPPEKDENNRFLEQTLVIKDSKPNISSRIIISTTNELTDISFQNSHPEMMELKPWVAYQSPSMIGGMLTYTFQNKNNFVIPPKKGFRQVRKSKNINNRHILVFDYMLSGDEMKKMTEAMVSNFSKNPNEKLTETDTKSLEDAINELRN